MTEHSEISEEDVKLASDRSIGPYIGVDLDGTLAQWDGWKGADHIGEPIPRMVDRVKNWLENGQSVKIFTARVSGRDADDVRKSIAHWCKIHIGTVLSVTNIKDFELLELWDDRAIQVEKNTGRTIFDIMSFSDDR